MLKIFKENKKILIFLLLLELITMISIFIASNSLFTPISPPPLLFCIFTIAVGEAALGISLLLAVTRQREKSLLPN